LQLAFLLKSGFSTQRRSAAEGDSPLANIVA